MIITTLQEANLASACCPCELPGCSEPRQQCESITVIATSADDDYTDAVAAWIAGGSIGPEPEKPAGYDDVSHGSWLPFLEPGDENTILYRTFDSGEESTKATGTIENWVASTATGYGDVGIAYWFVASSNPDGTVLSGSAVYRWDVDGGTPPPYGGYSVSTIFPWSTETVSGFPEVAGIPWVADDPPAAPPCTDTTRELVSESRHADAGGSADDLSANYPPVAFIDNLVPPSNGDAAAASGWPNGNDLEWTDLTERLSTEQELGSGVSKSDVRDRAANKFPEEWPETAEGAECVAKFETDWPTIGDIGEWPECDSEDHPISKTGTVTITKARYRLAPPEGFGTETPSRTYYEAQWDEYFFPDDPEVAPSLVASRSWLWNGDTEDPWSEWFVMEVPEQPGETRIVNLMVRCWKSTRIGNKPSAFGETYTPPDP